MADNGVRRQHTG